jgi:23S rRNA A1618 N6-methylase RlmF
MKSANQSSQIEGYRKALVSPISTENIPKLRRLKFYLISPLELRSLGVIQLFALFYGVSYFKLPNCLLCPRIYGVSYLERNPHFLRTLIP